MDFIIQPLNDAVQYATIAALDGDEEYPVATLQRRRVYETGPAWRIYDTDGRMVGRIWSSRHGYDWIAQRAISIVRADMAGRD